MILYGHVHPLCHTIIKEDEEYEVIFTGEGIVVYDLEGNEKTVTIADDDCQSYITTTQPLKDLFAITIADYTFVLNRTVYA